MVIFDIPHSVDTFNPECRPDFALKPGIPSLKDGKFRIPKNILGTLDPRPVSLIIV